MLEFFSACWKSDLTHDWCGTFPLLCSCGDIATIMSVPIVDKDKKYNINIKYQYSEISLEIIKTLKRITFLTSSFVYIHF